MKDIIDVLEEYRLENRITLQELANKLGVAFSTINRWLKRKVNPNPIHKYHISKLVKK